MATRAALEKLVELCIRERAAFLIIAGDLYDHDCPNMQTAVFLRGQLARLARCGIRTVIVKGNHDADNRITSALELPARILSDRVPDVVLLDDLPVRVAIHGQSFRKGPMRDNLAAAYRPPVPGCLNIGLLHTSLAGDSEHAEYAPCALSDLQTKGYGYWALGHIHKPTVIGRDPWIVYPGNLQGRHAKETGPKGCFLVEAEGMRVLSAEHVALDVFRWQQVAVDLAGAGCEDEIYERARAAIGDARKGCDGLPGAIRITLCGRTLLHRDLRARPLRLRQTLLELAEDIGEGSLWVERITDETVPAEPSAADPAEVGAAADILALAREIAADRQRLEPLLRAALQPLRSKLPEELKAVGALALLDDPPGACEAVCRLVPMLGARLFSSKQSPG